MWIPSFTPSERSCVPSTPLWWPLWPRFPDLQGHQGPLATYPFLLTFCIPDIHRKLTFFWDGPNLGAASSKEQDKRIGYHTHTNIPRVSSWITFTQLQLVGAQPSPCCWFARHFVGKIWENGHPVLICSSRYAQPTSNPSSNLASRKLW